MRQITGSDIRETMQMLNEGISEEVSDWKKKMVKNKLGHTVQVGSLAPDEQEKYKPKHAPAGKPKKAPTMKELQHLGHFDAEKKHAVTVRNHAPGIAKVNVDANTHGGSAKVNSNTGKVDFEYDGNGPDEKHSFSVQAKDSEHAHQLVKDFVDKTKGAKSFADLHKHYGSH